MSTAIVTRETRIGYAYTSRVEYRKRTGYRLTGKVEPMVISDIFGIAEWLYNEPKPIKRNPEHRIFDVWFVPNPEKPGELVPVLDPYCTIGSAFARLITPDDRNTSGFRTDSVGVALD